MPTCFGECQNITLQLVDPAILTYQIHAGNIEEVLNIWDAGVGVEIEQDYATYDELEATEVTPGNAATCLAEGFARLGSIPFGAVTAHVKGHKDNLTGNYISNHGALIRTILRDYGGFSTSAHLDQTAFDAFIAAQPNSAGLFLPAGDQSTILEVVEALALSAGAFIGQDRSGRFRIQQLGVPASLPHWSFTDRDILRSSSGEARIERLTPEYGVPWKSWGVGYGRNWTVQSSSELAAGVSQERRQFLESESRYAYAQSTTIALAHSTSSGAPLRQSLFRDQSAAAIEATRLLGFYGLGRAMYRVSVKTALFSVELGQTIRITYNRWDLEGGKNFIAVGIEDSADVGETELLLFG
jgi:hypothetical protein